MRKTERKKLQKTKLERTYKSAVSIEARVRERKEKATWEKKEDTCHSGDLNQAWKEFL